MGNHECTHQICFKKERPKITDNQIIFSHYMYDLKSRIKKIGFPYLVNPVDTTTMDSAIFLTTAHKGPWKIRPRVEQILTLTPQQPANQSVPIFLFPGNISGLRTGPFMNIC